MFAKTKHIPLTLICIFLFLSKYNLIIKYLLAHKFGFLRLIEKITESNMLKSISFKLKIIINESASKLSMKVFSEIIHLNTLTFCFNSN